jgi:3-oxoacyl-[acyl-carrier protein] reductase
MVVLVTGSSKGIGRETIKKFASEGYDVVINYNNSEKEAFELQKEIEKFNVKSMVIECDITDEEQVKNMVDKVVKNFKTIDVLVNNAGIAIDTTFEDKTVYNFRRTLDVNLIAPFVLSRLVGDIMYKNKKGTIINISSTNGIDTTYPESLDYDASKAGLISLTHNLAAHYAPYVRVNAICPGWVNTPMNETLDKKFKKEEESKILLQRFANPSEIADAIYNISISTYINDSIIRVDGGERP